MEHHIWRKSNAYIEGMKEYLIQVRFELDENQIKELLLYQARLCDELEWVEMDHGKLIDILNPILSSPYLHQEECIYTLKRIIFTYYQIRIRFDHSISDSDICLTLANAYTVQLGAKLHTLVDRVEKMLVREGGCLRYESTI